MLSAGCETPWARAMGGDPNERSYDNRVEVDAAVTQESVRCLAGLGALTKDVVTCDLQTALGVHGSHFTRLDCVASAEVASGRTR